MTSLTENGTKERFELPIRVYIEDSDAGGSVFHAKYLHYMERARTEWVRSHGLGLRAGLNDNISDVGQKMNIRYRAAARVDDELQGRAEASEVSRAGGGGYEEGLK